MIIGSLRLIHGFMEMNLIDEDGDHSNSILLGKGIPFFKESAERRKLKLCEARQIGCGVIGMHNERHPT
jgi:dihydrofolate reductase